MFLDQFSDIRNNRIPETNYLTDTIYNTYNIIMIIKLFMILNMNFTSSIAIIRVQGQRKLFIYDRNCCKNLSLNSK